MSNNCITAADIGECLVEEYLGAVLKESILIEDELIKFRGNEYAMKLQCIFRTLNDSPNALNERDELLLKKELRKFLYNLEQKYGNSKEE